MPCPEAMLTQRQLNRALLARQLLLERRGVPLPKALERIGGIQAQYPPSMYLGLWARVEGFERDALTRALERRSVVQGTLMRATIHLVSRRDYWRFAVAVREARRSLWARTPWRREVSADALASVAATVRKRFAGREFGQVELDEMLRGRPPRVSVWRNGVGLWLDLVRVPPAGTWERRRADRYAAAEDWIGPPAVDPVEARRHLVRSYLRGFGPAARKDIADYTGLPLRTVDGVLDGLELRRFRTEDDQELFDLPRAPLPDPDTPAPVRFLAAWDSTLLVHARRTGILPEEHRPRVFNVRTPHSVNTFLVDGLVSGSWRFEKGTVRLEPFRRLGSAIRRELDAEGERLAAFHA